MAAYFVTGSGTDIGKTWITAGLLRHWRALGLNPDALKPVASGFDPSAPEGSDPVVLLQALGRPADAAGIDAIAPFRFAAPLSPDQAAAREGRALSVAAITAACAPVLAAARGPVLIEGAGGIMTPLNGQETMLDLALALELPVLFVAGSYLGAISHALTGLAALGARGGTPALIVINETPGSTVDLDETAASLTAHAGGAPVLILRRGGPEPWPEISRALGAG